MNEERKKGRRKNCDSWNRHSIAYIVNAGGSPSDHPALNFSFFLFPFSFCFSMSRASIQAGLDLKGRRHFIESYLNPALDAGLIEMTLPDKPTSRHQRYRRTAKGEAFVEQIKGKNDAK
ncbi:MAG: hypothetical protein OXR72_04255 [Gemmatimonadota bacterium]|nr:hypothetical protein [Gemmatimonadota bacterium]